MFPSVQNTTVKLKIMRTGIFLIYLGTFFYEEEEEEEKCLLKNKYSQQIPLKFTNRSVIEKFN